MTDVLNKYDYLLTDDGPAAIVLKQRLQPVGDEVIFPPTYAAPKGDADQKPRYNRDPLGPKEDGRYVCAIDSVGSQANRIEPLFKKDKFKHLVPQIVVKHKGGETHLLDAGHRIADAIIRFSDDDHIRLRVHQRLQTFANDGMIVRQKDSEIMHDEIAHSRFPILECAQIQLFRCRAKTQYSMSRQAK